MEIKYFLNGVNLTKYGVYVSGSEGLIGRPKVKPGTSYSWPEEHGEQIDLAKKIYEKRTIQLDCFIKSDGKEDFVAKTVNFAKIFDAPGTHRLMVIVDPTRPLVYEVYLGGDIEPKKKWKDGAMVGTFRLDLIESQPIKRVVKYTGEEGSVTFSTSKNIDIYWGDGQNSLDVTGETTRNHSYDTQGTYYIVLAGDIDSITDFETNGIVLWSKL